MRYAIDTRIVHHRIAQMPHFGRSHHSGSLYPFRSGGLDAARGLLIAVMSSALLWIGLAAFT